MLVCTPESARRYTTIISALEDVTEAGPARTMEVALVETAADWQQAAEMVGVEAHEDGGTIVATGEPEKVDGFLAALGDYVEDVVRMGPVARPDVRGGV